jgi:hypothetical protein
MGVNSKKILFRNFSIALVYRVVEAVRICVSAGSANAIGLTSERRVFFRPSDFVPYMTATISFKPIDPRSFACAPIESITIKPGEEVSKTPEVSDVKEDLYLRPDTMGYKVNDGTCQSSA